MFERHLTGLLALILAVTFIVALPADAQRRRNNDDDRERREYYRRKVREAERDIKSLESDVKRYESAVKEGPEKIKKAREKLAKVEKAMKEKAEERDGFRDELVVVRKKRDELMDSLRQELLKDPEVAKVDAELKQADKEMNAVRDELLVSLRNDADYKKLKDDIDYLQEQYDEQMEARRPNSAKLIDVTRKLNMKKPNLKAMEDAAVAGVPRFQEVALARKLVADRLSRLEFARMQKFENDPEVVNARTETTSFENKMRQANQEVLKINREKVTAHGDLSRAESALRKAKSSISSAKSRISRLKRDINDWRRKAR